MSPILKYAGIIGTITMICIAVGFNNNVRTWKIHVEHNDQLSQMCYHTSRMCAETNALKEEKKETEKEIAGIHQTISDIANTSPNFKRIGEYTVTAYTSGVESCGEFADGKTATGKKANYEDHIIAADWKVLPVGSCVYIETLGWYTVQDCGSAIKGNRIDVLMSDVKTAMKFGRKKLNVWVKTPQ